MRRPSYILLDIDGTLLDSNDAHARAWVEALQEEGVGRSFRSVRNKIGMGGDHLLPSLGLEESAMTERIQKRRREIFQSDYLPHIRPMPGARALVKHLLSEKFSVAVASSAEPEEARRLLLQGGLDQLLASRIPKRTNESSKPDPDILLGALRWLGAKPNESLLIGDTPYDLISAERAGIHSIALSCGGWPSFSLKRALAVYRDPAHLLAEFSRSPLAQNRAA